MKVGIMSMQRILNYGSFMQALSLKRMIESLGHEVVFVDYLPDVCIADIKNTKKKLKRKIKNIIGRTSTGQRLMSERNGARMPDKQKEFNESYPLIGITPYYKYHSKVDILVIGSDEVFNCLQDNRNVGFSMELFGKNNRAKKLISYAASFGNTTYDRLNQYGVCDTVAKYLKRFDSISVRDNNSAELVKKLCGRTPLSHLDPVLAGNLEECEWSAALPTENYIIVYGYARRFTEAEGKAIQGFAKKHGLKTIALCEFQTFCDMNIRCKPHEILAYFKNAEYVITDTFHGSIFSILYHKPFAAFCRTVSDTGETNSEKLTDMLMKLHLENRLVWNLDSLEQILMNSIDYSDADRIRKLEKKRTLNFLKENLSL